MGVFTSCDSEEELVIGEWERLGDFEGVARSSAVSFVINGKAYVGTGYSGTTRLKDFWMYEPATDNWTRLADFPGEARSAAVGFSANGKGYVGTGYNGSGFLKDFYEYDPATNAWTQIADFPGSARLSAIAMSFDQVGYVGAGYDGSYLKDFWKYNPATGAWEAQAELVGARRLGGFAFTTNGKGYVGGGTNAGVYNTDLLEFDPATGTWKILRAFDTSGREPDSYPKIGPYATAFAVGNQGYVVNEGFVDNEGQRMSVDEVWQYEPTTDSWTKLQNFRGSLREGAVGFGIGDRGYVGLGNQGTFDFKKDFWTLNPAVIKE
ncbi:hypothetical protein GCM10007389_23250 [Pontibacter akesuensis]|nr:hypothetical protein GCM10007389_23250 [Pontibacter akesuensis]